MAKQYLYKISILSKKNKNPLDCIAYYSGETQFDVANNKKYASTSSARVRWNDIVIPDKTLQKEMYVELPSYLRFRSSKKDLISNARNILWQQIDNREDRSDSQFARLFEVAIPFFLTERECVSILKKYSSALVSAGMIVDASLHDFNDAKSPSNMPFKLHGFQQPSQPQKPHDYNGFLMCTLRSYQNGAFENKNRNWNKTELLIEWRSAWVELLSKAIEESSAPQFDKDKWMEKMFIYPEFHTIQQRQPKLKIA